MEALRAFGGMFGAFVPWRRGWGWGAGIGDVMKLHRSSALTLKKRHDPAWSASLS